MEFIQSFAVDFAPDHKNITAAVKQLDTGSRFIEIEPRYNGDKIDIRSYTVKLFAERADHTVIIKDCEINTSGNIFTEITKEITAVAGMIQCDIKLFEENNVISSAIFYLNSIKSVLCTNIIYAYKNRSLSRNVKVISDGEIYQLESGEKLIFGVKSSSDDVCVIRKELTSDNFDTESQCYKLKITSTEMTNIDEGSYIYDIALKKTNGQLEKVVRPTAFIVCGCVVEG